MEILVLLARVKYIPAMLHISQTWSMKIIYNLKFEYLSTSKLTTIEIFHNSFLQTFLHTIK